MIEIIFFQPQARQQLQLPCVYCRQNISYILNNIQSQSD